MFLLIYLFRMNIIYKFEKNHNNVDDFSRISINCVKVNFYSMTIISVSEDFLKEFKNAFAMNFHFHIIYKKTSNTNRENIEECNLSFISFEHRHRIIIFC